MSLHERRFSLRGCAPARCCDPRCPLRVDRDGRVGHRCRRLVPGDHHGREPPVQSTRLGGRRRDGWIRHPRSGRRIPVARQTLEVQFVDATSSGRVKHRYLKQDARLSACHIDSQQCAPVQKYQPSALKSQRSVVKSGIHHSRACWYQTCSPRNARPTRERVVR